MLMNPSQEFLNHARGHYPVRILDAAPQWRDRHWSQGLRSAALINFLHTPEAAAVIKAKGMEPVPSR